MIQNPGFITTFPVSSFILKFPLETILEDRFDFKGRNEEQALHRILVLNENHKDPYLFKITKKVFFFKISSIFSPRNV